MHTEQKLGMRISTELTPRLGPNPISSWLSPMWISPLLHCKRLPKAAFFNHARIFSPAPAPQNSAYQSTAGTSKWTARLPRPWVEASAVSIRTLKSAQDRPKIHDFSNVDVTVYRSTIIHR